MIRKGFFWGLMLLLVSSCGTEIPVEDVLYESVEKKYAKDSVNLKKELYNVERLLIKNNILEDTSWQARKLYLEFVAEHDSFPEVDIYSVQYGLMISPLNFEPLAQSANHFKETNEETFLESKLHKVFSKLESAKNKDRLKPKVIANSILSQLKPEDYQAPLFRYLILTLAVETTNTELKTLDVQNAEHQERMENLEHPACDMPPIELRNGMTISVNYNEEILVRGAFLKNKDKVSDRIVRYYTMNRKLSQSDVRMAIANTDYEGYNFPFYSFLSKEELNEQVQNAREQYLSACEMDDVMEDYIEFKHKALLEWMKKRDALQLLGESVLQEVHSQAYIGLEWQHEISKKMKAFLYQEIDDAFTEMRDKESLKVFGQSYSMFINRKNIFVNDLHRIWLLETLFPKRIVENPYYPMPAPPIEVHEPPE